jgi:small subunit ribosomal protein S29
MFQTPSELRDALDLPDNRPTGYKSKTSPILQGYADGLRKFDVPSELSIPEAAALFEVWMKDKALHSCMFPVFVFFSTVLR